MGTDWHASGTQAANIDRPSTKGSTGARRPRARNAEAYGHVRYRVDGRLRGLTWLGCQQGGANCRVPHEAR